MVTNPTRKKSPKVTNPNPEVTKEEILAGLDNPMLAALEAAGITEEYLTDKLQEELDAKETRVFNAKGKVIYSDDLIAWKVRQEARRDAVRYIGGEPAEKRELSGEVTLKVVYDDELEGKREKDKEKQ